jgi:hypothetical protein
MKCVICGKRIKVGQRVVPTVVGHKTNRYDIAFPSFPEYVHIEHLDAS